MKKILYIEDHEDTTKTVKTILCKAGFNVDIALSGKDGIKKAKNKYDLIIMDIMMPDMSGWDVFETIKKKTKETKYIFLTVLSISSERKRELERAGIADYITKPLGNGNLVKRIKKVLQL